jgi:hypothetical protein
VGRVSQNELTETKQRYAIRTMKIFLIKVEIRGNTDDRNMLRDGLTQRWRSRVYIGAGAADNSHPGNDDFRTAFYNIVRTLALNTPILKI